MRTRANVTHGSGRHKTVRPQGARRPRHRTVESLASPPAVASEKLFRIEEANSAVPRLELLMERLQRGALRLNDEMREVARQTGIDPASVGPEELLRHRPTARALVEELDAIVHEIEEMGAHLKDVQLGLVDFPSERDGKVIYLCWQFGEPEVAFWHGLEDGFGGRQPLPGARRERTLQ